MPDSQVSRRELRQLKWLTALVPGTVVLIYEFARQEALEHVLPALPVQYGNLVVWVLVLLLTYGFATFVFSVVERLQAQAIARSRDLATLSAVLEEKDGTKSYWALAHGGDKPDFHDPGCFVARLP